MQLTDQGAFQRPACNFHMVAQKCGPVGKSTMAWPGEGNRGVSAKASGLMASSTDGGWVACRAKAAAAVVVAWRGAMEDIARRVRVRWVEDGAAENGELGGGRRRVRYSLQRMSVCKGKEPRAAASPRVAAAASHAITRNLVFVSVQFAEANPWILWWLTKLHRLNVIQAAAVTYKHDYTCKILYKLVDIAEQRRTFSIVLVIDHLRYKWWYRNTHYSLMKFSRSLHLWGSNYECFSSINIAPNRYEFMASPP